MIGRLREGATVGLVQQQVDALNAANDQKYPEFHQILQDAKFRTVGVFLRDDLVRDVKRVLYLLWGGVGFVLVLGCLNIANLVVVRSSARTREMATRHAIGGDLARLARQLVTETTILALAGGALGLAFGWSLIRWLSTANLAQLPRGYEIQIDPIVVAVTFTLTVIVGIALGVAPAARLWRMKLDLELREETRGGTSGRRANLVRQALATAQVAIALALLTGAGLLLASFRAVLNLDYGFDPAQVATATFNLPAASYKDPPALVQFESRSLDALRALPGVEAAGASAAVPFSNNNNYSVILAEGYVMQPGESLLAPMTTTVTAGYFEAMHIPVIRGRSFDARDTANGPTTAIVDERLARKFWPNQDPIGRRLYRPSDLKDITKITDKTQFFTIVGV
ncbi:MAG TPA: FtsX-like permease family protein, partial [Caldimonas sp.]|nr:FtsX-like permease family protein [Caldimonas sp.]